MENKKLDEEKRKAFVNNHCCSHGNYAPSRYEFAELLWDIWQMQSAIATLKDKAFEQQIQKEKEMEMIYQKLFDYMSSEHGVTLLQTDMQEICRIVNQIDEEYNTALKVEGKGKGRAVFFSKQGTHTINSSQIEDLYDAIRLTRHEIMRNDNMPETAYGRILDRAWKCISEIRDKINEDKGNGRYINKAYIEGIRNATGIGMQDIQQILHENPDTVFKDFDYRLWLKNRGAL